MLLVFIVCCLVVGIEFILYYCGVSDEIYYYGIFGIF